MLFKKTESRVCPKNIEEIAGGRYLIRKNIVQEKREDASGEEVVLFVYDEAVANVAEYAAFSAVQTVEAKREADIVDEYTLKLIEEGTI